MNPSSQANAHVFSANFVTDCVKNPCRTESPPADFCLVIDKIMLENPHTFLMKTGSMINKIVLNDRKDGLNEFSCGR